MTCYHPLTAWQSKKRNPNTGKSMVVFSPPGRIGDYTQISVACGQCIGCRLDYSKVWAMRCYHESKLHNKNCFITLTYDDAHVPWSSFTGEQTLFPKHLTDFWKRLRKKAGDTKLRYFACGEYGDETNRPHYHAIIFGYDFDDKQLFKSSNLGFNYYISDTLVETWRFGQCTCCDVSYDTCAYVARYVVKKLNGELGKEKYEGIEKEFCRMSRRPGIGKGYYDKYHDDWYSYDKLTIIDNGRTRTLKPCRYYDSLYDLSNHEDLELIKKVRIQKAMNKLPELCVSGRDDAREVFKICQTKSLKRSCEL